MERFFKKKEDVGKNQGRGRVSLISECESIKTGRSSSGVLSVGVEASASDVS